MKKDTFHLPCFYGLALGLACLLSAATSRAEVLACPPSRSRIEMTHGSYSSQPGVTFLLHNFTGMIVPLSDQAPLCFQKLTVVSHAVIFVSNDSLTHVFAQKLGASGTNIRDLQIINSADGVLLKGVLNKVVPVHFSIFGPVTTDGTALVVHADKIDAYGIPLKALLGLLGQHLSSVLGLKNVAGVTVQENTMSFFPEQIAHLKGNLHSVATSPSGLTLTYTPATKARHSDLAAASNSADATALSPKAGTQPK